MLSHCTLTSEPPASRRLRRSAPLLLLLLGVLAGVLGPGLIAGDRSFQTGLCDNLEHAPAACASLEGTSSVDIRVGGGDLVQADQANRANAFSTAVASIADDDRQLPRGFLRELRRLFEVEDKLATVPSGSTAE
jgi:hypothetical protein